MLLYDKITVIDIEATCWEDDRIPEKQEREIIEIGICELNLSDGSIEDKGTRHLLEINHIPNITRFEEVRLHFLKTVVEWIFKN
ncbi:hypothetical protein [Chryseobacterium sp.]|uniref:hypothetical protein n=1 Tax=Chryseobacterium sp. TaxID=1871047 RepID=UPI002604F153|nr:hypothetical protein [Chryseobacterium sp.]